MTSKKIIAIVIACLFIGFLLPVDTFSQDAAPTSKETKKRVHPREEYPPDQRPEENYLARFKAIEVSQDLMAKNIENIYILNVIKSNIRNN